MWISLSIVGSMTKDTVWRVTGFMLRVSSSFYSTSVRENNWKNVCWSTREIMKGRGKYIVSRFKLVGCLHGDC